MEIAIGTKIGRKTITCIYTQGPYTYVDTVCDCSYATKGSISLGMLLSGKSLTCRGCKRELLEEANARYLNMVHTLRAELAAQLKKGK